ncbi:hypothetical protein DERP_002980 [Dermatophagoides pteronyssinus]|uniref:E2F-associated phosphoprotein-like n=1 Tax=Dermatophagoides pteronyssinus TaxID=6956 RepID=A0ABQ8JW81_DERPT|nr:hypothetical protein DERP_002980 [Dermatophagoides pteronyssinus]
MDQDDCYYEDILDGISDAESFYSRTTLINNNNNNNKIVDGIPSSSSSSPSTTLLPCFSKFFGQSSSSSASDQQQQQITSNIIPKDSNIKNKSSSNSINENSSGNHNNKLEKRINDIEKEKIMDELFYDPDEDDSNQQWMDRKKFLYESRIKSSSSSDTNVNKNVDDDEQRKRKLQSETKLKKPRTNDATLNCPCCLSLLCLDCQRHEIYKTQYRAMFVQNCRIDYGKKLFIKNKDEIRKRFQKRKKRQQQSEQQESENEHSSSTLTTNDQYYPVHCNICNTQVAVYDLDEVYHFFSVIASH